MLKSALIIAALTVSAPAFAQSVLPIPQASPQTMAAAENGNANRGEGRQGRAERGERGERNPAGKAVRQACMADIKSLCDGIQPGGGRIQQCIRGKREQLSAGCKSAMMEARQQKQAARGQGGRGGEGQGNRERGQAGPKL
jgi:hypothetical protein